jgi:hypothetical protein
MKKKIQFLFLVCIAISTNHQLLAQYGKATGFLASYHYSTLPNRDDLDAGAWLDYATTFKFGAGLEHLTFISNNFGWGYQLNYWGVGQKYTGVVDSINGINFKAATDLNYVKSAFLVHIRSYNRYNPEARFRFTSYLGPYFSFLASFKDRIDVYDKAGAKIGGSTQTILGTRNDAGSSFDVNLKNPIYKLFDWGFVIAPGVQYMISKKTAIVLQVRGDVSAKNVEATGNLVQKITPPPYEKEYDHWNNLFAKYNSYPAGFKKDPYNVRGTTKSLTVGAQLTIRFYAHPQY